MPIQAFIDESGGKGQGKVFTMAVRARESPAVGLCSQPNGSDVFRAPRGSRISR